MTRLYVLVEGQTEEAFVKELLTPHLRQFDVWIQAAIIVETSRDAWGRKRRGGGRWQHWFRDLRRLTSNQRGSDVRFTTMFDLYGLPIDFPELENHASVPNTIQRAALLEDAMAKTVADYRLIPNIQRHEFETLVLAALDSLAKLLEDRNDVQGLSTLRQIVQNASPEEVNDGKETAPSKRLETLVPSYRKTVHGPLALGDAGLSTLRSKCPRFDAWITKLEGLGTTSG